MTGYATAGTMTTVQQSTDPAAKPTSRKRFLTVAALALMLVPLLAGCIRVQVSMGVSANDRVTGQVVAAAIPANEADKGPQLNPTFVAGGQDTGSGVQEGRVRRQPGVLQRLVLR